MFDDVVYTARSREPILDFVRRKIDSGATPCFRGFVPYYRLSDAGLFIPDFSSLRVFHYGGIGADQVYFVRGRENVRGTGNAQSYITSPEGIHLVRKVLSARGVTWEVHHLDLRVLWPE